MRKAKSGDTVKIHYVGKLEDGTVFSSSTDRDPIEITVGEKRVAPFEQALVGMQPGESKTVHVPAEQAYGGRGGNLADFHFLARHRAAAVDH